MNPGDKGGESEVQKMRLVTRNEMEVEVGRCCQGQIPTMIEIRQRNPRKRIVHLGIKVSLQVETFYFTFLWGHHFPKISLANALQRLQKKVLLSPLAMGHSVTGRENLN